MYTTLYRSFLNQQIILANEYLKSNDSSDIKKSTEIYNALMERGGIPGARALLHLFISASGEKNATALYILGCCYQREDHPLLRQNLVAAQYYFIISSNLGCNEAAEKLKTELLPKIETTTQEILTFCWKQRTDKPIDTPLGIIKEYVQDNIEETAGIDAGHCIFM